MCGYMFFLSAVTSIIQTDRWRLFELSKINQSINQSRPYRQQRWRRVSFCLVCFEAGSARCSAFSFSTLWLSVSALVVKRRSLNAPVPVFDLGVLHHVVECLQALHHSEDAEHSLQKKKNGGDADLKTLAG